MIKATLKKLNKILDKNEKKKVYRLILFSTIVALLDVIGVLSVLPLLSVLSNPQIVEGNKYFNALYRYSNIDQIKYFLMFISVAMLIVLISSLVLKAYLVYGKVKFVLMFEAEISKRLFENYLHKDYGYFAVHHKGSIGTNILSEVRTVAGGLLSPLINITTQLILVIMIGALLLMVDYILMSYIMIGVGLYYILFVKLTQKIIKKSAYERSQSNKGRFHTVSEGFSAAKEIKLYNIEGSFVDRYSTYAKRYAKTQSIATSIAELPRYALEAIAFGGLVAACIYLISQDKVINEFFPVLSFYAFAGYKLMPAIQQIYSSYSQIKFSTPALDCIYQDCTFLQYEKNRNDNQKISFNKKIELKNISYKYTEGDRQILKNINVRINTCESLAVIGESGGGKSTLINIIAGLLVQDEGILEVDGEPVLNKNRQAWRDCIGYVPQKISILNASVAENIAFGVPIKEIDMTRIKQVSKDAQIDDYINEKMAESYQTIISENGSNMSGGQIQRIAIARALYRQPKLLIFDEATNSLDKSTEKEVLDVIELLAKKCTIIFVTHKLADISRFNKLAYMKNGEILASGNYNDVIKNKDVQEFLEA